MTISMMAPGSSINLKVMRNGSEHDMTVKLAEMPSETARANPRESDGINTALDGVEVEE